MNVVHELKIEICHINERLKYLCDSADNICRLQDSIASTKCKYNANEAELLTFEPAAKSCERKSNAIRDRTSIEIILNGKGYLTQLKNAVDVMADLFPETLQMTLSQVIDFISNHKSEMKTRQENLRVEISRLSDIETKYTNMIKRREYLREQIEQKEALAATLTRDYVSMHHGLMDVEKLLSLTCAANVSCAQDSHTGIDRVQDPS